MQSRELVAAYRRAQREVDRLVAVLDRAGLGDAVLSASVVVGADGGLVGDVFMTVDGVVRVAELLRVARAAAA